MQDKLNIAVFVDYDNIEIGLKSTLRREFDVSLALDALKERGDIVAKFAYANWGRQDGATRQMAENAVQMVQRIPSPRGDKNGADINLALDALEMAFTHTHVNAFAIVSGDSDFIPLVNKLKEYGKTVFVVGGKAFTSTILQQNCHEFISFESLMPMRRSVRTVRLAGEIRAPRASSGIREPLPAASASRDRETVPIADRPRGSAVPIADRRPSASRAARFAAGHAAGGARSASAGTPRGAAAARAAEVDHAAARFGVQRARLRSVQLLRFRREAEARRTGERHRHRRALRDRAQNVVDAGASERSSPRICCRRCATCWKIIAWSSKTAARWRIWPPGSRPSSPTSTSAPTASRSSVEFLNYAQDKTVVRLEPHEDQGMLRVSGRGILSARRAAQAGAGSGRGRRGRGRAAALCGRPADHLRAESSAGQGEEERRRGSERHQRSRRRIRERGVHHGHARRRMVIRKNADRTNLSGIGSDAAGSLFPRGAGRRFYLCERAGTHRSGDRSIVARRHPA
jgi:uncharacterized protein (TIGR00288 family)